MTEAAEPLPNPPPPGRVLLTYLLGRTDFDEVLNLQRRLVYEVDGARDFGAVVVCEHPPGVTIGREGSRVHVCPDPEELNARGWPVRWVSRGGGAMLHLPGQVACYPLLALDQLGLTPARYLADIQAVVVDLLREYGVKGEADPARPGVRVNGRRVCHVGAAVRGGVSCFGLVLNVNPDLDPFHAVHCDGDPLPMTSLQRETPGLVRVAGVRQRLVELVADRFGFDRVSLFHSLPGAEPRPSRHAATTRSR